MRISALGELGAGRGGVVGGGGPATGENGTGIVTRATMLGVLWILCLATSVCAQEVETAASLQEPVIELVRILPDAEAFEVSEMLPLTEGEGLESPPAICGQVTMIVESALPGWGVAVELGPLAGPVGVFAQDRIWISDLANPGGQLPLADRVIVAESREPASALAVAFTLGVEPTWLDVPGTYRGELVLIPFIGLGGSLGEGVPQTSTMMGQERRVEIEVTVPEITMVSPLSNGFRLQAGTGWGRFDVEPDIEVMIASNSSYWEIRLEGSPFRSEEHEIPLDRVLWAKVNARGEAHSWTSLAESNVLLAGEDSRGVFRGVFRLALQVTLKDHAGEYGANLQLVSSSGL
ncbi:MAG: hypothetical protein KAW17_01890 [Candidatus Eisenbacteria sp.]|nr:hypothetical protein [Candidatus Eisenbacteria bacterium]